MSNPFENNYFNSIFSNAFSHPFFSQNSQFNPQPDNSQNNINFNMNNFMSYNGQPFQQPSDNHPPPNPSNYSYSNNNLFTQKKTNPESKPPLKKSSLKIDSDFYKDKGNQQYQAGSYNEAIESYSKAISMDSTQSTYYSNRANCYKRLGMMSQAQEDIQISLELDDQNIKANMLCGLTMAEQGKSAEDTIKIDNAIRKLSKAIRLCYGQGKQDFEKQMVIYLLRAKKLLWYKKKEILQNSSISRLQAIEQTILDSQMTAEDRSAALESLREAYSPLVSDKTDYVIPDYLCCRITLVC